MVLSGAGMVSMVQGAPLTPLTACSLRHCLTRAASVCTQRLIYREELAVKPDKLKAVLSGSG